jgi:hypothetical protein
MSIGFRAPGAAILALLLPFVAGPARGGVPSLSRAEVPEAYGRLPLAFEANRGQHAAAVDFLARGTGYGLWLTPTEAVFALGAPGSETPVHTVRMQLQGSNPRAVARGEDRLPGLANYMIGNDPARWRRNVPTFRAVRYPSVYPGVDLVYYGNQRRLEYDFVVEPGSDPSVIALRFAGVDAMSLAPDGGLSLRLAGRELRWEPPVLYQTVAGQRQAVSGAYRLIPPGGETGAPAAVGFTVAAYDPGLPLVIDPVLAYSTFLGGEDNDRAYSVAVDSEGSAYVTGGTQSDPFPTLNAYQPAFGGSEDVFVTKLTPDGSALVYSTYVGGTAWEAGRGIAIDAEGNAYVTGDTTSAGFPFTVGAHDTVYNGNRDAFVFKLNPAGDTLEYSTFLGDVNREQGEDIDVDGLGRAYVTGWTQSPNFPTTLGAFDTSYGGGAYDGFVTRLRADGSALSYSAFLGGLGDYDYGYGITVLANEAYVTGSTTSFDFPVTVGAAYDDMYNGGTDVFVARVINTGASLVACTFVGSDGAESGEDVALGPGGHVFITGWTSSPGYPTTPGAADEVHNGDVDVIVTKLNPTLLTLTYSTFIGGTEHDAGYGIAVNGFGGAAITGLTASSVDFPLVIPTQAAFGGGVHDAFVLRVAPTGSFLNFSSFQGGPGDDQGREIALDGDGLPYFVGFAASGFPTTPLAFQTTYGGGVWDAFAVKIEF